jgi:hypothetical protein
MTYTSARCTVNKLLMMGRGTSRTCRAACRSKFGELVHLVGFIIKKFWYISMKLQDVTSQTTATEWPEHSVTWEPQIYLKTLFRFFRKIGKNYYQNS